MRHTLLLLSLLPGLAMADENPAVTVAPEILKEFREIEALAGRSDYLEAERRARALLPHLGNDPAAKALILRNLASLYGLQKHYAHAAETLAQSLELHALPAADATQALLEMGQYQVAAENYPKAAEALSAWIEQTSAPSPEQFLLLAEVRTRLRQYAEAAALVEKAITRASEPKPEWYQLLLGLYHESRDFKACAKVLAGLIQKDPNHLLYWQQLIGIYQEAGQEQQTLAIRQLMYVKGLPLSSGELVQLVQMLRYRGMPGRAAEALQREIDAGRVERDSRHLELLADVWTEARELRKAAAALEKAASLSDAAETHHRLGQIYSELHDWNKAQQTLERALTLGSLKNPGGAYLLLGLAQYKLNAKRQARDTFIKALKAPGVRKTAQQWLDHIDQETKQRQGASH